MAFQGYIDLVTDGRRKDFPIFEVSEYIDRCWRSHCKKLERVTVRNRTNIPKDKTRLRYPERMPPDGITHNDGRFIKDGTRIKWVFYDKPLLKHELPYNVCLRHDHWVGRMLPNGRLVDQDYFSDLVDAASRSFSVENIPSMTRSIPTASSPQTFGEPKIKENHRVSPRTMTSYETTPTRYKEDGTTLHEFQESTEMMKMPPSGDASTVTTTTTHKTSNQSRSQIRYEPVQTAGSSYKESLVHNEADLYGNAANSFAHVLNGEPIYYNTGHRGPNQTVNAFVKPFHHEPSYNIHRGNYTPGVHE